MVEYQICTKCIMDTSDPKIQFDAQGVCNHCKGYEERAERGIFSEDAGKKKLEQVIHQMKEEGKNKDYDCIIGVSGGVDSTYVAYKVKEFGLRPLAIHFDNGWNSELAVSNVEKALKILNIDLYTYVIDWDEFKDIQLAFLRASVPDLEIPTDHAIWAVIHKMAAKQRVRHIVTGINIATEAIGVGSWSQGHADWYYIKSLHKLFGNGISKSFPYFTYADLAYYKYIQGHQTVDILNYIPYNKQEAIGILEDELGWRNYGGKHYESIYTRFIQGYILPVKFGFDKRRAHLSTLICSGQITREAALQEMEKNPYPSEELLKEDQEFVIKKLGLREAEFENLIMLPNKDFWDYPSYHKQAWYKAAVFAYHHFGGKDFRY